MTKLGRLVKAGKITSMEQIYLHSLPIKEYQIVDWFLPKLKDEVMKVTLSLYPVDQPAIYWREVADLLFLLIPDQTCTETNPGRSTHPIQGDCCDRRLGRPCWSRYQDVEGSSNSHSSRHHHRQTLSPSYPKRILGYKPRRTTQLAHQAERKMWQRYCQSKYRDIVPPHSGVFSILATETKRNLTRCYLAHPRSSRYRPCRLPGRQTSPPISRC